MKFSKKWFTLIEMTIAISIMALLVVSTYIPYSYINLENKISISSKSVSSMISKAHNYARNGLDNYVDVLGWERVNKNVQTALYLEKNNLEGISNIIIYSYEYDTKVDSADSSQPIIELLPENILESKLIESNVFVDWIEDDTLREYDNMVILFDAISWESSIYTKGSDNKLILVWGKYFTLKVWRENWDWDIVLGKNIKFYTDTNVVDITKI